jgi:beta-N-acetylhexosaminidase
LRPRPIPLSLLLIAGTITAGLTLRLAHLGMPFFVTKYGGSTLWALMICLIVSSLRPCWRPYRSAASSGLIAATAELFKLYHFPELDMFRQSLPGALLLGRVFSVTDFIAYAFGIMLGVTGDRRFRLASFSRL